MKNRYREGDRLKRRRRGGAWIFWRFKGGLGKKKGSGVFKGGGLINQCTLWYESGISSKLNESPGKTFPLKFP